jgi:hypothetical protein
MQMDAIQVKTAVLDQFIWRHDYKDNHDVYVYNYLSKHHQNRQKSCW